MKRKDKIRSTPALARINTEPWPSKLNGWAERRQWWLLAAILTAFVILAGLSFDPKPFVGGDNANYVLLSQSLANNKGLTEIWTPGTVYNTLYPFGFPLLLAPVSLLRMVYPWYKLIPFLSALAGLAMLWLILRRQGVLLAATVTALCAVNPTILDYSHWVLSELSFMAFLLLAVWLMLRWEEKEDNATLVLLILATTFTNHIRSSGIVLLAGFVAHLLIKRKFRAAVALFVGFVLLSIPWAIRTRAAGSGLSYVDWLLVRDPYQVESGNVTIMELVQRVWHNARQYFGDIIPQAVFPYGESGGSKGQGLLGFLLTGLPMLAGIIVRLVKKSSSYDWCIFFYFGLMLLWPSSWTDVRFALPVLPFFIMYLFQGYQALAGMISKSIRPYLAVILFLVLFAASLAQAASSWSRNLEMQSAYRKGDHLAGYDPAWRSFFTAAEWIKTNTPENSNVVSRKPSLFYLSAQRKTFCYPFTANRDSVLKVIDRADYIMVEPVSGTGQKYLIPAIQPLLDKKYKIIYAQGEPPTYVLQIIK
ncbi:MAG: ArnT family glycosyltransferase [Desulfocucumaceae bacterium]